MVGQEVISDGVSIILVVGLLNGWVDGWLVVRWIG